MAANHTFSRPVEIQHDELFRVDKRVNGLDVNPHNSHVKDVSDDIQWDQALEGAAVSVLSQMPGSNVALQAHGALVRSALRGNGRGRDR